MTIAFDALSNVATPVGTALSWTHTPAGTPKGVLVYVIQNVGTADEVTGVTYGSATLNEISGSPLLHTTSEPGGIHAFFLGSGIPTGTQTVTVSVNGTGSIKDGVCVTLAANAATTKIQTVGTSILSDSVANPTETLTLGGITCWVGIGFHSGTGTVGSVTPSTGWSTGREFDFGNQVGGVYRLSAVTSADTACGWTQAADDAVAISVAVTENLYTLTAALGTFTETGINSGLLMGHRMAAAQANFALTGLAVTLTKGSVGYTLTAAVGTFTETGPAANLLRGRRLVATQQSYTETGPAANLLRGRRLAAAQASFTLSGQAAGLLRGRRLAAAQASFTLSGQAAGLLRGRRLVATQQSYTETGPAANLLRGRRLIATQQAFVLTGIAAGLSKGTPGAYTLAAAQASFTLSGQAAGLLRGRRLAAVQASFALSGQAASLRRARIMASGPGSFVLSGIPATLSGTQAGQWQLTGGESAASGTFVSAGPGWEGWNING